MTRRGVETQRSRQIHTEGNYPFGWKQRRVLFLEEDKRAINAKFVLPLPFIFFFLLISVIRFLPMF